MTLSRDEIVAAIATRKREVVKYDVPEWGGEVGIRRLSASDLETTGIMSGTASKDMLVSALAMSLCNDDGDPLFGIDAIRELDEADAIVTMRLFGEVCRVNGLMTAELEEMMASFAPAQPDDSSSS